MKTLIPIHKLSAQEGLTSRTLRHWESEELFTSSRDEDSGWRVYDENAVLSIRLTALLRGLDIPIEEIRKALTGKSYSSFLDILRRRIAFLSECNKENESKKRQLEQFLPALESLEGKAMTENNLPEILGALKQASFSEIEKEEITMSNVQINNESLKFITLPPMRVATNVAVGVSPEDDATTPVVEWIEASGLSGTAKLYGGNMPPMPSGDGKPYGYGMSATIPEGVSVPEHLKEAHFPGGVYARLESSDDIPGSWDKLMKLLASDDKYTSDRSRFCFEEHIRDDKGGFIIVLLEPVKERV